MKAIQKMIKPFVSRELFRVALRHVFCDKVHGRMVASDGQKMIVWESDYADDIKSSCLLPLQAFPRSLKENVSIKASIKSIVVHNDSLSTKVIFPIVKNDPYPAWHKIFDGLTQQVSEPGCCLNPAFLGAFSLWDEGVYLKQYRPENSKAVPTIVVFPDTPDPDSRDWLGLVMPVRLNGDDTDYAIERFGAGGSQEGEKDD